MNQGNGSDLSYALNELRWALARNLRAQIPENARCLTCTGRGDFGGRAGPYDDFRPVTCKMCGGSGLQDNG